MSTPSSISDRANGTPLVALLAISVLLLGACEKKSDEKAVDQGHSHEKASEIVVTEQAPKTPPTPKGMRK